MADALDKVTTKLLVNANVHGWQYGQIVDVVVDPTYLKGLVKLGYVTEIKPAPAPKPAPETKATKSKEG